MKRTNRSSLLTGLALAAATPALAQFNISTANGLFDPSFRGAADTTWFGWGTGSFDGTTNDEIIDNPAPTFGTTTVGLSFTQSPTSNDILSGTDNIYTGSTGLTDLLLTIPIAGSEGLGFTTVIVQGRTAFGGYGTPPAFADLGGASPTFALGPNANGAGQFWVKYEIAGNATSYDLTINLPASSFISISELEIDTFWSASGFATDTATVSPVPEPSSLALGVAGLACVGLLRRRRA